MTVKSGFSTYILIFEVHSIFSYRFTDSSRVVDSSLNIYLSNNNWCGPTLERIKSIQKDENKTFKKR